MTASRLSMHCCAIIAASMTIVACNARVTAPVEVTSTVTPTFTLDVGQELDITLGTFGSGSFDSLPTVSSSAVRFLDAAFVRPYVPAGPRQLFRFAAQRPGRAILTFRHSDSGVVVSDTVIVR